MRDSIPCSQFPWAFPPTDKSSVPFRPSLNRSQDSLEGASRVWRLSEPNVTLSGQAMARQAALPTTRSAPRSGTHTTPRTRGLGAALSRARELCTVTLRGALVLLAAALALYVYGVGELDGVWYVAGLGLSALGALSLLSVLG